MYASLPIRTRQFPHVPSVKIMVHLQRASIERGQHTYHHGHVCPLVCTLVGRCKCCLLVCGGTRFKLKMLTCTKRDKSVQFEDVQALFNPSTHHKTSSTMTHKLVVADLKTDCSIFFVCPLHTQGTILFLSYVNITI